MIIVVFGLPGSGKSYFASHLAKSIKAEYINSDGLRKKMFNKRTYSKEEKQMVYDEMILQMKETLKQHKDIVLDATFYKNAIRKKLTKEGKDIDEIIFIEVQAAESLIKQRLQKSREDSEANFQVYKKIQNEWEPFQDKHLILQSTDDNIHEMLEKATHYLQFKNDKGTDQ